MEFNKSILNLFKAYLTNEVTDNMVDKSEALKYGIYLEENVNKELFDEIIKQHGKDGFLLNQTFHKSIEKVANTDINLLFMEQIIHYFTTYGMEEIFGETDHDFVFIPKEKLEIPELEEDIKLVAIKKISEEELEKRLQDLVTSGIALSRRSVRDIITLSDFIKIEIDEIKNKEIRIALFDKYNKVPKDPVEFMRYFLYKAIDSTLLIKDKNTLNLLKYVDTKDILDCFNLYKNQHGLDKLAQIFNRFKPIFVALKRRPTKEDQWYYRNGDPKLEDKYRKELNNIINIISKLSKTNHKPLELKDKLVDLEKWLSSIANCSDRKDIVYDELTYYSIWRVIRALNYMEYDSCLDIKEKAYKIRNGKVFIKENKERAFTQTWAIPIFKEFVIDTLKKNVENKTVYLPGNIEYALPQSEKQFVGNIPFNSIIDIPNDRALLLGIHWTNVLDKSSEEQPQELRVDLDIKLSSNKYSISWNSRYRDDDNDLIFTGDMTDAPINKGGASEYIYISDKIKDTIMSLTVNNYTTSVGNIPFEFIIAYAPSKTTILEKGQNYVINPNDIIAKIPCMIEKGQSEHSLGVLFTTMFKNGFVLTDLSMRNVPVSKDNILDELLRKYMINYIKNTENNRLQVLLKEAGAIIKDSPYTEIYKKYALIKIDGEQKLVSEEELSKLENYEIIDNDILKREKVPVDLDLSLENLNKDTLIKLFID